jgi:hypothetical protein
MGLINQAPTESRFIEYNVRKKNHKLLPQCRFGLIFSHALSLCLQKSLGQRAEISLWMGFSAEIIHDIRFHHLLISAKTDVPVL